MSKTKNSLIFQQKQNSQTDSIEKCDKRKQKQTVG